MDYPSAVTYLDSLVNYETLPSQAELRERRLERMRSLLRALGNPHERFQTMHVAGTKGKGSVSAMLYSVLAHCGLSVGLYTSPHLDSIRERIRMAPAIGASDWISETAFADGMTRVRAAIEATTSDGGPVTYFEALTALACDGFAQRGVRWAVLEVGLGGRLDATNVTRAPVAVITPISLDHTDVLGETVEAIAAEKAGIIKPGQVVISAPQAPSVRAVLASHAARAGAQFIAQGAHVVVEPHAITRDGSTFSISGRCGDYPLLALPLLGRHQIENAVTAIAALETVQQIDPQLHLTITQLRAGLAGVEWPGRGELLPTSPPLLLDGAHNRASAERLRELLQDIFPQERIALVLGMSQGKDVEGVAQALAPIAPAVWVTHANHPRALPADALAARVRPWLGHVHVVPPLTAALADAQSAACSLVVVTGSLFIVGEAKHDVTSLAR